MNGEPEPRVRAIGPGALEAPERLEEAFEILRSTPHGHVAAVLGARDDHIAVAVEPSRRDGDDLWPLLVEHLVVVGVALRRAKVVGHSRAGLGVLVGDRVIDLPGRLYPAACHGQVCLVDLA